MQVVIAILAFCVIIIIHELGHFTAAKLCGIQVNEFAIGMGPVIFRREGKETDFCIRAFPIGGACLFDGMEALYDPDNTSFSEEQREDADPHSYPNASVGARIATVLAGPFANFVIGLVFAIVIVAFTGTDLPVVYQIMENSAAEEAGLEAGDTIRAINGEPIHIYREVQLFSMMNYGEPLRITYERDGGKNTVTLTPRYNEEAGRYYIGLVGSGQYLKCGPLQTFQYGLMRSKYLYLVAKI